MITKVVFFALVILLASLNMVDFGLSKIEHFVISTFIAVLLVIIIAL